MVPVEHDPFSEVAPIEVKPRWGAPPQLEPVEHDPFAGTK